MKKNKGNTTIILGALGIVAAGYFMLNGSSSLYPVVKPLLKRGCNSSGCGSFGASRGNRDHNGIDFIAPPGAAVYAPFNGVVTRAPIFPYASNLALKGMEIKATNGDLMKFFYMTTNLAPGTVINRGDVIGHVQNMKVHYSNPEMPNHLHGEIYRNGLAINFINEFKNIA